MYKLQLVNPDSTAIEEAFGITMDRKKEHALKCREQMKKYHDSKRNKVPIMLKEAAESSRTLEELAVFAFSLGYMSAKYSQDGIAVVANNSVGEMIVDVVKASQ